MDIISAIDSATGCHQCGNPLGSSPSSDFCSEFCRATWHKKRTSIERVPLRRRDRVYVEVTPDMSPSAQQDAIQEMRDLVGRVFF